MEKIYIKTKCGCQQQIELKDLLKEMRGILTQKEFAEKIGMTQAGYANFEVKRIPKIDLINKIAEAAGKQITWIIEDIEK